MVGCGDGALHVIDISRGDTLYAIGAHKVGGQRRRTLIMFLVLE